MSFLDTFTGAAGAEAAQQAAAIQGAATPIAMNFVNQATAQGRADLEPFKQAGVNSLQPLQGLVNDPNQQKDFIQNNPFYQSLADDAQSRLFSNQAARGKVGSGETAKALQNSMMLLGQDLVNNNVNQNQNIANMGLGAAGTQAAASQYAGRSLSELATGDANARAAGVVGAANADAAGANNILGSGLSLAGLLSGGDGLAGIGSSLSSLGSGLQNLLGLGGDSAAAGLGDGIGTGAMTANNSMTVPGGATTTTYGAPSSGGGGFSATDVPSPSSVLGGSGGFSGFAGLSGLGSGIGTGAVPGSAMSAGAANAGFSGFTGLSGLGSGIGTGASTAAPTVGAAAGGGQAAGGGLLAGGAGAALGAAIPLGMVAIGKYFGDKKRAAKFAWAAPFVQQAAQATPTTINGITGLPITIGGRQYLVNPDYRTNPGEYIGKIGGLKAYDPVRKEYGTVGKDGFYSDVDSFNDSEALGADDDVTFHPQVVDKSPYVYTNPANWSQRTIRRAPDAATVANQKAAQARAAQQAAIAAGDAAAASAASVAIRQAERAWEEAMWGDNDFE